MEMYAVYGCPWRHVEHTWWLRLVTTPQPAAEKETVKQKFSAVTREDEQEESGRQRREEYRELANTISFSYGDVHLPIHSRGPAVLSSMCKCQNRTSCQSFCLYVHLAKQDGGKGSEFLTAAIRISETDRTERISRPAVYL